MLWQKPGNLIKYGNDLASVSGIYLHDIASVKLQDIPFFLIRASKIFMIFQKKHHALRHASYQDILFKYEHCLVVEGSFQFFPRREAWLDIVNKSLLSQCPGKFFKIKRIHFQMSLFWRYNNIFYIFPDWDQGTCLNIIISSVRNKIFYCLPCFWKHLYLIKNDQRIPLI